MKLIKALAATALVISAFFNVTAQTLPVGTTGVEDYYRRSQLLGQADSSVSFMVRPLFPKILRPGADVYYPDSTEKRYNPTSSQRTQAGSNSLFMLLPVTGQTSFNSHHPYGWNDGAMIPAKGLQLMASGGFYLKKGMLSIQVKPELVMAANPIFDVFNKDHYDVIYARYYDIYNNIDLPVRFGHDPYVRAYWGQSSIRLNWESLSFGLSTENLWWGPGMRNSLLMSNNAPGFKHLTLNTTKPLRTPIGSFEGQLIAGRLENSGFRPLTAYREYFGTDLYVPKPNDWRYLAGIVFTWQPKWVPGLFLGFSQSSQTYGKDLNSLTDYVPLFTSTKKVSAPDNALNRQDQRSSVFMRWLWTKEHAEVYFEFGRNNNTKDLRQSLLLPDESRAYTFGLRKLLPINKSTGEGVLIGVETTTLQENSIERIKQGLSWYVSKGIRQGYTNRGEVLGAGIGPGANLQSLDVSWVKGLKRLGLQFERYAHNNDFYYYAYYDSFDFRRHWVDLSLAANGEWNYKNYIFNAKLQGIHSINYQWYLKQNPGDPYFVNGANAFNLQVQLGATYRF